MIRAKNKQIYLDYAAATPLDKRVLAAMEPFFTTKFHNPSSDYAPAREVNAAMEDARRTIAQFLGAKPTEIIFTAGGTEANNLAIAGVASKYPGKRLVATAIEHDSVLKPLEHLAKNGWPLKLVKPKKDGVIDGEKLTAEIDDNTVLVSVMYANNEVGTIQPISKVASRIKEIRRDRAKRGVTTPLYLHSDACQAPQYLDMHVSRLGVDLMVINSDKIYGPKQCGALYVRAGTTLEPIIHGGGQEFGLRSGTENIPAVIGFGEAIKITEAIRAQETERMRKLQAGFATLVSQINGVEINGSMKKRLPNNLHVTFPGADNERLLMELDQRGIYASSGSACSAKSDEPSYVLRAMGLSVEQAKSSVRFSLGRQTTARDLKKTFKIIKQLVA